MFVISATITCILTVSVIGFLIVSSGMGVSEILEKFEGEPEELFFEPLEITTNIDTFGRHKRYIKINIVVSTLDEKDYEKQESFHVPLRDVIVKRINGLTWDRVADPNARDGIKEDIKKDIERNTKLKVEGVYLTDFVVH